MTSNKFWLNSALLAWVAAAPAFAQNVLSVIPPESTSIKAGQVSETKIRVKLKPGFHVNSNKPADEFLIPLKLTWAPGIVETVGVEYPKPTMEKYTFSEKPLSVFSGEFELATKFKATTRGMTTVSGKLRYQACNDTMCLPPKTIEIQLPVNVE